MVLFVLGIVGLSWYAVVPAHYGKTLVSGPPGAAAGSFLAVVAFTLLVRAQRATCSAQRAACPTSQPPHRRVQRACIAGVQLPSATPPPPAPLWSSRTLSHP